jgi:hypothetical protein
VSAEQFEHDAAPNNELAVPNGQFVQVAEPLTAVKVPAEHCAQYVIPELL